MADRAGFRDATVELLRDLRRAADLGDAQAGAELARKLRNVCSEFKVTSLLSPLEALGAMDAEEFRRHALIKVAQVQREHGAVVAALQDIFTAEAQPSGQQPDHYR